MQIFIRKVILCAMVVFLVAPQAAKALSYEELKNYYYGTLKGNGKVLGAVTPSLPRAYVDTTMPATSNTCTINVASGGDFQAAIDSAKLGDTICLQAGATFVGPFYLPKKTIGSGWLTIRTANLDNNFVSPGTRVSPSESSKMPKLVSRGFNDPVLLTKNGANNYRLIGLEVTKAPDTFVSELIVLGDWWESVLKRGVDSRPEFQPYNFVLDRMYIHGDMVSDTKRGVRMHCNNCAVIDSHISQIQSPHQDTQAIAGWNSEGPFKIVNNYLEATGENVMFGGADPGIDWTPTVSVGATVSSAALSSVDGLTVGKGIMFTVGGKTGEKSWTTVRSISGNNITFDPIALAPDANSKAYHGVIPSDFEIRKNYFAKPRYWNPKDPSFAGKGYFVKNLFETKAMHRLLLDSNIFENSWPSAQNGPGLVIKSHNQDGGCPYCFTQDITITNNMVINTTDPIVIVGTESYSDWNKVTPLTKRVKIQNNLFYNEANWTTLVSRSIQIYNEPVDVEINHNTIFGIYNLLFTNYEDSPKNRNFFLTNNILQRGAYGIGNVTEGKGYLDSFFPGYTYAKNVLINSSATFPDTIRTDDYFKSAYPDGTLVTSFAGVGFTDANNTNFKLINSSPFKNAGTDGKDIGADIDVINNAVAGVKTTASQVSPPPPPAPSPAPVTPPPPVPTPTPTPVVPPPTPVSCGAPGIGVFTACYYDNMDFTNLKISRSEPAINFDWGLGSPDSSIGVDQFSAVWQGNFNFEAGDWEFVATTDDGMKVSIDGEPVINKLVDQPSTTYKIVKTLSAGSHAIRVDYFENGVFAVAKLAWSKVGASPSPQAPVVVDSAPPTASSFNVTGITSTAATISFSTNESVTAVVYYQAEGASAWKQQFINAPFTSFSLPLALLSPQTVYKYYAVVKDLAGNISTTSPLSFSTLSSIPKENNTSPTPTPSPAPAPTPTPAPSQPINTTNNNNPASGNSSNQSPVKPSVVLPVNVKVGETVKFGSSPTIYLVREDGLYPFHNFESYKAYVSTAGNQPLKTSIEPEHVFTLQTTLAASILNQANSPVQVHDSILAPAFKSGTLVNDNGTIYLIIGKNKTAFTNLRAFLGLGYRLGNIVKGNTAHIPHFGSYYIVSEKNQHPWGSWLLYNKTVYYSHEKGMIPVTSWDIFINNGGEAGKILNMNNADISTLNSKPNLPAMEINDTRIYR